MKSEIDIAFELLKSALLDVNESSTPDTQHLSLSTQEWWSLFRLLQQNHVAALCYDVVAKIGVPREVLIPWLSEREKAVDWYRHQSEVQQEIIDLMHRNGIETLVLKGTHLAKYYPEPELREFGDLDLYFYDRHDEADKLAAKKLHVTVNNEVHHHTKYNYRGVTVESHYDFINSHTPRSNRRYEAMLKELTAANPSTKSGEMTIGERKCASTFEVLFLLRHMAGHFAASRITLRDVVDWHLLTKATRESVDWDKVAEAVEESGMTQFMNILNTIAANRLGSTAPHSVADSTTIDSRVEHDIVYGDDLLHGEKDIDGLNRLAWKLRRYRANRWKQPLVYAHDSRLSLFLSSLSSHAKKPQSILHKQ